MDKLTAKELKKVLWETLQKLKLGSIEVSKADSIASQSREIIRVVQSQQSIIKQAGEKITQELIEYAIE